MRTAWRTWHANDTGQRRPQTASALINNFSFPFCPSPLAQHCSERPKRRRSVRCVISARPSHPLLDCDVPLKAAAWTQSDLVSLAAAPPPSAVQIAEPSVWCTFPAERGGWGRGGGEEVAAGETKTSLMCSVQVLKCCLGNGTMQLVCAGKQEGKAKKKEEEIKSRRTHHVTSFKRQSFFILTGL